MHCSSIIVRCLWALALLAPQAAMAQGQQGSGSPYSAYGLGEFVGSTQVSQATMGDLGVAVIDPFSVVYTNPASYASLQRTTFETGIGVRNSRFTSSASEGNGRRVDLLGFTLGVPFGKGKFGLGLGVNPVTEVGYQITDSEPLTSGSGDVRYEYSGDGGLNRGFMGFGWAISTKRDSLNNGHRLSFGANATYLFGRFEETRKAVYPIASGFYNTSAVSSLVLRDVTGNVGLHYQGDLRKRTEVGGKATYFLVGVTAELPTNLGAQRSELVTSYGVNTSGVEFPFDTLVFSEGNKYVVGLPVGLGAGFTVFNLHWSLSAEARVRDWSDLRLENGGEAPSTLSASTQYGLGASWRPAGEIGGTFLERSIYRLGVRYNNDYLTLGGTQLKEIGMSFGVSLPIMNSETRSRLTIGGELGQRGTTENGLLQERFATFLIGLTITPGRNETWFKKRRIE